MVAGVSTSNTLGVNLTQTQNVTSATPEYPGNNFALGTTVTSSDGGKYIYVTAPAAIALGAVCIIDASWNATPITTANATVSGFKVGVASQVPFAAADRGWLQIDGLSPAILVAASTPANAQLYTTATAGQLSNVATSSIAINGIVLTVVSGGSAGVAAGLLNGPEILLTT